MKKLLSLILVLAVMTSFLVIPAKAYVSYPEELYLTQPYSGPCTLYATTMMLRARAYRSNSSTWLSITPGSVESVGWVRGSGLIWDFNYTNNGNSYSVSHRTCNGMTVSSLQALLTIHPEGIVIYCPGVPHAQLITDVDGGVVYSADSSGPSYFGRRPLASTYLGRIYGSQEKILSRVTFYWYVASYRVTSDTNYSAPTTVDPVEPGTQTVSDGIYRIACAADPSVGFDIQNGSTANGANLRLWKYTGAENQQFKLSYRGNGCYTIACVNGGKVLDAQDNSNIIGTNVLQQESDNSPTQQWILRDAGNGNFNIICRNGLFLEADGAKTASGTNVAGWNDNGSSGQKWKLIAVDGKRTLSNGVYRISSALDPRKCMGITGVSCANGANVHLWDNTDGANQKFRITYQGDGFYSLIALHSGKLLDMAGACAAQGTNIQQHDVTGSNAQKWMLKDAGDGFYYIVNSNGLYLDVSNAGTANGTNVQGWVGNRSKAQKWSFISCTEQPYENGIYRIASALDETKVLDITGSSTESGANVHLWSNVGAANQQFKLTYLGNGCYSIVAVHSGKALDVSGGSSEKGANIQQYDPNGTNAQQWILRDTGDGFATIQSKTGLYLDVNGAKTDNGTNIHGWIGNSTTAQQWKLIKLD